MRVIAIKILSDFWKKPGLADAEQPLKSWYAEAVKANWSKPSDIKGLYRHASFVGDRVVFNIAGNKYRLVAFVRYSSRTVYVRFVGTHKQYDKIDVEKV
jgi:mRNA interferase HigB